MKASELYRGLVRARAGTPRYRGIDSAGDVEIVHAENPVCGDALALAVAREGPLGLRYDGHACLVCVAATELLAEAVQGKTRSEGYTIAKLFLDALDGGPTEALSEDLTTLLAVRALPVRVACARLSWDALARRLSVTSGEPAR